MHHALSLSFIRGRGDVVTRLILLLSADAYAMQLCKQGLGVKKYSCKSSSPFKHNIGRVARKHKYATRKQRASYNYKSSYLAILTGAVAPSLRYSAQVR